MTSKTHSLKEGKGDEAPVRYDLAGLRSRRKRKGALKAADPVVLPLPLAFVTLEGPQRTAR